MAPTPVGQFNHDRSTFVYHWKIPNFSTYIHEDTTLNSPILNTSEWEGFRCHLHMHLRLYTGLLPDADEMIYIKNFCSAKIPFTATCGILDNRGVVVQKKPLTRMHAAYNVRFLMDPANGLLDNDTLTIWCEFRAGSTDNPIAVGGDASLRLDEFDEFENLMSDRDFTDVIFKLADKTIMAHKCILAKRSPVFAAMFQSQMKETQENKVVIEDVGHDVFIEMLRFIYSGKVHHLDRIARDLLAAADKYLLENLKNLCGIELGKQLCVENAPEILELADKLRAETLKKRTIKYIVANKKLIVDRSEFRALTHELIYEVCKAMSDE